MKAPATQKADPDMPMSAAEFDRIMGRALRVKPEEAKPKQAARPAKKRKARK